MWQDISAPTWRPQGDRTPRPYGVGLYSAGRYATNPPVFVDRWRPQGERTPRPYGVGLYSAGRYATNPPVFVDRWHKVHEV